MNEKLKDFKAFPVPDNASFNGMTLRDFFACGAMQSLMVVAIPEFGLDEVERVTAEVSYKIADAMLEERSK